MALATQCPHCQTTFRVAHDQLKLRAGLVRCGACKQIFNGIENLIRLDDNGQAEPVPAPASAPPSSSPAPSAAATVAPPAPATETDLASLLNGSPAATRADAAAGDAPAAQPENPMLRMTLLDFAHVPQKPSAAGSAEETKDAAAPDVPPAPPATEEDPVEQAINDLQSKPWRASAESEPAQEADPLDQADAAGYEEPDFVRQARQRHRLSRMAHSAMSIGSGLLVLALLLQTAVAFRDQLAARFPSTRPALESACGLFGCQVGLPARIDVVSIESSELQTQGTDSNRFVLSVLLRNQGSTVEAWPYIELTLNDVNEKPLVRRVFVPRDYLPAGLDPLAGFAARSEQSVRIHFELSQVQASGYRVYVFYP
ncbi:DUF3426 domain-containing protein [Noviherbaspirillum aridicola]|uniref:Membrane protein n=1 Tax=Noviherbaspirillum aridicola TaxID=2849687 RepID=A0ABQ4Q1B8_9BURK|nr:DUF3426 domain-containing protein [Noviherbaspirillum aridicola]GIZ50986.1 membrane protein [Noviherbaspirillum aridicola]